MIAVDTNLLVYAHRPEMPFHERARDVLTAALAATEPVAVPWPCAHEFLAVVSNPRIFKDPTGMDFALNALRRFLDGLDGGFLAEGGRTKQPLPWEFPIPTGDLRSFDSDSTHLDKACSQVAWLVLLLVRRLRHHQGNTHLC